MWDPYENFSKIREYAVLTGKRPFSLELKVYKKLNCDNTWKTSLLKSTAKQ